MNTCRVARSIAFCLGLAALVSCGAQEVGAQAPRPAAKITSPAGLDVAEVRTRATGGDGLFVNGKLAWPMESTRRATAMGAPRWSKTGHAVAMLAREQQATRLVVVLVDSDGQALEWQVPAAALPAKAIMWMDAEHVSVGPREMDPKMVASWKNP